MASWGNQENQPFPQDMDSNGRKLKVRNTSGAYAESDWRVEIEETSGAERALRVIGKAAFEKGGQIRGTIKPDSDLNELCINAETNNDPNVRIGSGESLESGNKVTIKGKHIFIGATADEQVYRVALGGPVSVTERLRVPFLQADLQLQSQGLEAATAGGVLNIGTAQTHEVLIGRDIEHFPLDFTAINTKLFVRGECQVGGQLVVGGTGLHSNADVFAAGNIDTDGTVSGANITADNTVSANTVNAVDVNATGGVDARVLVSQDGLVSRGIAELKREGCFMYVPASVRTDRTDVPGMDVELLAGGGIAGRFRADTALVAEGDVRINGRTVLTGETLHNSPVLMQGKPIILGGEGENEVKVIQGNKRCEFWIGGKMRFYIDETGGHNA